MKRKELTKTFIMILNWKNPLLFMVYTKLGVKTQPTLFEGVFVLFGRLPDPVHSCLVTVDLPDVVPADNIQKAGYTKLFTWH